MTSVVSGRLCKSWQVCPGNSWREPPITDRTLHQEGSPSMRSNIKGVVLIDGRDLVCRRSHHWSLGSTCPRRSTWTNDLTSATKPGGHLAELVQRPYARARNPSSSLVQSSLLGSTSTYWFCLLSTPDRFDGGGSLSWHLQAWPGRVRGDSRAQRLSRYISCGGGDSMRRFPHVGSGSLAWRTPARQEAMI